VVDVLSNAGDQLPVMPLVDVVGSAVKIPPEQIAATVVKIGVTTGSIVTDVVATTEGQPPLAAIV